MNLVLIKLLNNTIVNFQTTEHLQFTVVCHDKFFTYCLRSHNQNGLEILKIPQFSLRVVRLKIRHD